MHNIITFSLIILIVFSGVLFAEGWERIYGGNDWDWGWSVAQTTDGGYIIVGGSRSFNADEDILYKIVRKVAVWFISSIIDYRAFGAGGEDVYLIKTNGSGDTIWTRTYGGKYGDCGVSIMQAKDGGYIITGWTFPTDSGYVDVYLIKTDSYGNILWTRTFGGSDDDAGFSVTQTTDDGYIITGWTESFGSGKSDVYLIKTNAEGDILWTRSYGGKDHDWGWSVVQTTDGGYVITGFTESFGSGKSDVYLIKTNAEGDILWTRSYGGKGIDEGHSVAQTVDGGYIIVGFTESYGAGSYDIYLIKTDDHGDTLWTRTYGGSDVDRGFSVAQTTDGGYIIVGTTESFGSGKSDVYLIKTNAEGDILWTRTYGGKDHDWGWSVVQTIDGGYIVTGHTESFGASKMDVYLIKTDSLGYSGIREKQSLIHRGLAKKHNIGVKEGSFGLGYEHGFASRGVHHCVELQLRVIDSSSRENLNTGVAKFGFGWINHNAPSSYWVNTENNNWLTFDDAGFFSLYFEISCGHDFHPKGFINPYLTAGIKIGAIIYQISAEDTVLGDDWIFTIPLVAACDIAFYTKILSEEEIKAGKFQMLAGKEVKAVRFSLTPFLKAEIPLYSPKYSITDIDFSHVWNEKFSDWWGLVTIGISFTLQHFVKPRIDSDKDGVPDKHDECPNTPPNIVVDERGCPLQHKIGKKKKINVTKELEEKGKFVTNDIHFEYNSHKIPPDAYPLLNEIGTALENHPNWVIEISGHTDNIGSDKYNQKLSEKRAKSVKKYLLANFDIDKNRIIAKGYGEKRPIASNDTPEGRALNRRVEFKIIKRN